MQDGTLHNYLNSLPPLETNEYAEATLNSLAFDFSRTTSFDSIFFNTLDDESIIPIRYLSNVLDCEL